jgi:hypothetical protein
MLDVPVVLALALTACLIGLSLWVGVRYKAIGCVGLAGVFTLPLTQVSVFGGLADWQAIVTALVTISLFVAGMITSKPWEFNFHILALAAAVALNPLLGALAWLLQLVTAAAVFSAMIGAAIVLLIMGLIRLAADNRSSPQKEE